jgi:hypothetical protein
MLGCGIATGVFLLRRFDVDGWVRGFGAEPPSRALIICIRAMVFCCGFLIGTLPFEFLRLLP